MQGRWAQSERSTAARIAAQGYLVGKSKSARLVDALASVGYVDVNWNVDSRDWAGGPAPAVARRVVAGVRRKGDGSVVLLHGWPDATPEAVSTIIAELRDGVEFVRVDAPPSLPGRRSAVDAAG